MSHIKKNISTTSFPILQTGTKEVIGAAEDTITYKKMLSFQTKAGFEEGAMEG